MRQMNKTGFKLLHLLSTDSQYCNILKVRKWDLRYTKQQILKDRLKPIAFRGIFSHLIPGNGILRGYWKVLAGSEQSCCICNGQKAVWSRTVISNNYFKSGTRWQARQTTRVREGVSSRIHHLQSKTWITCTGDRLYHSSGFEIEK